MSQPEHLKHVIGTELTDADLNVLLPGTPITEYADLAHLTVGHIIDANGLGVLLFVDKETPTVVAGHWLGVLRKGMTVECFDPYGGKKDPWYLNHTWVSAKTNKTLGQEKPLLTAMIERAGMTPIYSPHRLQTMAPNIDTCGRHIVVRAWNRDMSNEEYAEWLLEKKPSPDAYVAKVTFEKLGH